MYNWYELYLANHYNCSVDFDFIAPSVCKNQKLIPALTDLVDFYEGRGDDGKDNKLFKSFALRLIYRALNYFNIHMRIGDINENIAMAKDFFLACVNMYLVEETEDTIGNAKAKALAGRLLMGPVDIASDFLNDVKYFGEFCHQKIQKIAGVRTDPPEAHDYLELRKRLVVCIDLPETLLNKPIRDRAKYLLVTYFDDFISQEKRDEIEKIIIS